jgi:hypothetical protein
MSRRRNDEPVKRCLYCGARLQRRRYRGTLEDFQAFLRRQFCSLSCSNSRTKGSVSRKMFCAQARKQRKPFCEACGGRKHLHVHHVNEDWTDNSPLNLQTLCVFCHQFWHATHRRVGVKCSVRMPQIVFPFPRESKDGSASLEATETPSAPLSQPNSSWPVHPWLVSNPVWATESSPVD